MKNFKELQIWQKAMILVTKTYVTTKSFPKEEIFGLTSQLRRCSVSIPSNIAEGSARASNKEFSRFISIAAGSLSEFQTQIEIAKNINYINETEFKNLYEDSRELEAMIVSFYRKISAGHNSATQ
ncbi:MAG: four helix bundle protein [Flavobacterium sp. BFFFF1]|uniref:four helix bundle protein n=1 Tax=unclassified Flavobacterium TaxID=196869 RepID=UPI000BD83BE0|nr:MULTISPECIES: four helix bundle protein [unclassified Flavobacterium]OYU82057.1 MAG: four helix bundle protein [Flavobacterium sp. BFFFF1]